MAKTSERAVNQPPMIYFNVGWMEHYAGISDEDETKGAHGYLKEHRHGAESFNFQKRTDGRVRGYRPPGGREQTDITKLGASAGASSIGNVLVVWLAKEPDSGVTMIVGWYRDATIYRAAQDAEIDVNGERIHYTAEASVNNAKCLPLVLRDYPIQSSRTNPGKGFGQKPTWYGAPEIDRDVWNYIRAFGAEPQELPPPPSATPPKNSDPELRRKVEKAAVMHAKSYFRALYGPTCPIRSVELEAKGWDLEVFAGPRPLLVEVKGLLNEAIICELTPNEYENMMKPDQRSRYIVYVVNNALAEKPAVPIPSVFRYVDAARWATQDKRELSIVPKTGAVLLCGRPARNPRNS